MERAYFFGKLLEKGYLYIYIYKYEVVVELYSTRSMIKCSPFCIYNNDNVKKNDNIGD